MADDENWALEATQERIEKLLEAMTDGTSNKDLEKVLDKIEKNTKFLKKLSENLDPAKLKSAATRGSSGGSGGSSSAARAVGGGRPRGGGGGPLGGGDRAAGGGGGPPGRDRCRPIG